MYPTWKNLCGGCHGPQSRAWPRPIWLTSPDSGERPFVWNSSPVIRKRSWEKTPETWIVERLSTQTDKWRNAIWPFTRSYVYPGRAIVTTFSKSNRYIFGSLKQIGSGAKKQGNVEDKKRYTLEFSDENMNICVRISHLSAIVTPYPTIALTQIFFLVLVFYFMCSFLLSFFLIFLPHQVIIITGLKYTTKYYVFALKMALDTGRA